MAYVALKFLNGKSREIRKKNVRTLSLSEIKHFFPLIQLLIGM